MKLPTFIIDILMGRMMQLVARRPEPDVVIGGKDNPYLLRWHVIPRNRWFNIYFHIFCRSDDDRALHDHPWHSCSIILEKGYYEVLPETFHRAHGSYTDYQRTVSIWRPEGSVIFRRPKQAHRVALDYVESTDEQIQASTIFITGPRLREWGFHCPQGWKDWRDFTNFRQGDSTSIGPGCDDP